MGLKIKDLRKALKGLPPDMPVYIADHDHGLGETNGIAGSTYTEDQSMLGEEWGTKRYNQSFLIKGKYFVIKVG